jgi:hypothetical protein
LLSRYGGRKIEAITSLMDGLDSEAFVVPRCLEAKEVGIPELHSSS